MPTNTSGRYKKEIEASDRKHQLPPGLELPPGLNVQSKQPLASNVEKSQSIENPEHQPVGNERDVAKNDETIPKSQIQHTKGFVSSSSPFSSLTLLYDN